MPERLLDPDTLPFHDFVDEDGRYRGVQLCNLGLADCTATVVRYASGAYVPRHSHTEPVLTIVLKGELMVQGQAAGPGSIVECAGAYGPRVVSAEALLLVVQPKRARYVETNSPTRVALGTALRSEMAPLAEACARHHVVPFLSGVGWTPAAAACAEVIARHSPAAMVLVGCAGGTDDAVDVGDVVVCKEIVAIERGDVSRWQADAGLLSLALHAFGRTAGVHVGASFSSEIFVGSASRRREIGAHGAMCVETEGAALARACAAANVPWLMLRVVVDRADDERRPEAAEIEDAIRRVADRIDTFVAALVEPTTESPSPRET